MPSYRDSRGYAPMCSPRDYEMYRESGGHGSIYPSPNHGTTRTSKRNLPRQGQAWVSRVDSDDPRLLTGIRYFPETDTFAVPQGKRAGPFMGPCEVPGKEFIRRYPEGNAADLRRRRLDEYRATGRMKGRKRDRFVHPCISTLRLLFFSAIMLLESFSLEGSGVYYD